MSLQTFCDFAAILAGSTTSFNQNQAMGFLKVPLGRMGEELSGYPKGDPWDWYIYLLIYHENQPNGGK